MPESGSATSVTILGEEYWIRGASPEIVQRLAEFVDGRFRELQNARPSMDVKRLAVMVCLNIAEELHQERSHQKGILGQARERTRLCRESVERVLQSMPDEAGEVCSGNSLDQREPLRDW
jgi:cell division protein ZapA (FtsZ GTPase activity inhibitor)